METLGQSLHLAVDEMPPSTIDLDRLIRREQRSRGQRRVGWAVAGAAGTVLAVTAGAVLLRPLIPAQPVGSPGGACATARPTPSTSDDADYDDLTRGSAPEPTEPEADAVLRLSAAVTDALATHLAGRTAIDHLHPGCHWVQVEPRIYPARYYAWADISGGQAGDGASIVIMVSDKEIADANVYPNHETMPDGTVVGHFGVPGQMGAYRPDGTAIMLLPQGEVATLEELIALAADPGLTLYP
jgi:hypothetical protein